MAVFKCKMCGAQLNAGEEKTITCDYCGSLQTLPKITDEKISWLYERANTHRQRGEFDKAMSIYEEILKENPEDSESYWSVLLCKYGVEYVDEPATGKRVPTVNRAQYTSIFDDINYISAVSYADISQKIIYEREAAAINEIQKGILDVSSKEEPYDIFICYKETDEHGRRTHDSVYATELYHELTREGFKVFFAKITLEDKLGEAYEPYIFAALNSSRVMVVLGTRAEYFSAPWVKNEWSRYLQLAKNGEKKILIPAYKDMDPYDLPVEFSHLQAQDMSKLGFMSDLVRGIKKNVGVNQSLQSPTVSSINNTSSSSSFGDIAPLLKRASIFLEDCEWNSANEYCEKVLDIDPSNAQAYIYKLFSEVGAQNEEQLANSNRALDTYLSYKNAIRFADADTAKRLAEYNELTKARIAERQAQAEAQRQERERERRERERVINEISSLSKEKTSLSRKIAKMENEKSKLPERIERAKKYLLSPEELPKMKPCLIGSIVATSIGVLLYFIALVLLIIPVVGWILAIVIVCLYVAIVWPCGLKSFDLYRKPRSLAFPSAVAMGVVSLVFAIIFSVKNSPELAAKRRAKIATMENRLNSISTEMANAKERYKEVAKKHASLVSAHAVHQ